MDEHELLVKAREVLVTGGVIEGIRRDGRGGHCALGALDEVIYPGRYMHAGVADHENVGKSAVDALVRANGLTPCEPPPTAVAMWSNRLVEEGKPEAVIAGFDRGL